jgi:L-histidine Nalpha-methyltransferase
VQFKLTVLREETGADSLKELRAHVKEGLAQRPKRLSSKYFYDDAGSGESPLLPFPAAAVTASNTLTAPPPNPLFSLLTFPELYSRITNEDEYYLTRTEHGILTRHAPEIAAQLARSRGPEPLSVVELGAGDGRKTKILLRALLDAGLDFEYMPVDISCGAMRVLFATVSGEFQGEGLHVHGVVGEYVEALRYVGRRWPGRRTLVLFLGSSIGNFTREAAEEFLTEMRASLKERDMLLAGFDLKKDPEVLRRAYSDRHGVTRAFNLNLLTRLNREAGASFDTSAFGHLAVYNPVRGAMESYLLSRMEHDVKIDGKVLHFERGEPILTEYSYKFLPEQVLAMAQKAGFTSIANYYGYGEVEGSSTAAIEPWFMDALFQV